MRGCARRVVVTVAVLGLGGIGLHASAQQGVQINTDALGLNIPGDAANEPTLAVSPQNPLNMVVGWRQFPSVESDARYAGYAVTFDGGQTWINRGTLPPPPGFPDAQQSDPLLAVDSSGSFFYSSLVFEPTFVGVVYQSDTGGVDWQTPHVVRDGSTADKGRYTVDRSGVSENHYYASYTVGVVFSRSLDGGQTWERDTNPSSGHEMAFVDVGLNGEVFVASWSEPNLVVRRSDDAFRPGRWTWNPSTLIPCGQVAKQLPVNPAGVSSQVYLAIDRSESATRGNVYVLSSAVRTDDVCDVMFARSTDNGVTFSEPLRVNDDQPGADYQWMAAMSISPAGRLDALWFDTRADPNHFDSRLYYSHSYDGGLTWSPNRAVSDSFDPSIGYPQQTKIGDYFQCQSDNGSVSVVHPATFNGEQDIYCQRLHPMVLETSPLIGGKRARFNVTDARPNEQAWIVYSLDGPGYTNIALLDVPVNLAQPRLGVGPLRADAAGNVSWNITMPPQSRGRTVWFQAIQRENSSNVIEAVVE